jgi:DNA-directed RNA polymerases I, II, and III subunit RPABC2
MSKKKDSKKKSKKKPKPKTEDLDDEDIGYVKMQDSVSSMTVSNDSKDKSSDENLSEDIDCSLKEFVIGDNKIIDVHPHKKSSVVKNEDRYSNPKMTKYEMVRILGERTKQLILGAKPLIKNYSSIDGYESIAEQELLNNMIPFKIKRPMPNGNYEIWLVSELKKDHLVYLLNEN